MKFYFLWEYRQPTSTGAPFHLEFHRDVTNRLRTHPRGELVHDWNVATVAVCNEVPFTTDFVIVSGVYWPAVSERLKCLFEDRYPNCVQFLPFTLVAASNECPIEGANMYLGNVLSVVDCIDRRRTKVRNDDWAPRPNGTYQVRRPIWLKRSKVLAHPLFLIEGVATEIIARQDLCDEIQAGGFLGCYAVEEMPVSDD
jgi:hypothetical protein